MSNNNKIIQRNRVMTYFINATDEILCSNDRDALTARNVANKAGYNVATLYNYFSNLNHLILYTSVKYLHYYAKDLSLLLSNNLSPLECYLQSWDLFCKNSFKYPDKFHSIFFGEFSHDVVADTIKTCSEIFSDSDNKNMIEVIPILKLSNLYERDKFLLNKLASKNANLTSKDIMEISDMIILMYQSILYNFMVGRSNYTYDDALNKMNTYIKQVLHSYDLI